MVKKRKSLALACATRAAGTRQRKPIRAQRDSQKGWFAMTYKKWFVGAVLTGVMVTVLGTTAILFSARFPARSGADFARHQRLADLKLHEADAEIARLQDGDGGAARRVALRAQPNRNARQFHFATGRREINDSARRDCAGRRASRS